jgi:AAA family ATP:ADP antiporter
MVFSQRFIHISGDILDRLFDIRPGEFIRVFLMFSYIFLVISSLMIIKSVATAQFLSQFGASQLPLVFILVAVSAGLIASYYTRVLQKYPLHSLIRQTLIAVISCLLIFWLLISLNLYIDYVLYLFYIWVAIFAVIATSQFWIFANSLFNPREAKRLFGFIGAGAIAGGIFGGYLTKILAGFIGSENLILTSVLFMALCLPVTKRLREHAPESAGDKISLAAKPAEITPRQPAYQLVLQSRHLTFLAGIVGVSVFVAKLVEYQYSAIASRQIPDEDQLTAFFGFWLSNLNLASLLIQLFITRRIVGVFGVGTSLFFLPVAILTGAITILFIPSLWAAVFLKMSDGSLKNSINKSGIELLALPIPSEIKNQTKTFIDIFIDSAATGLSGFLLLLMLGFGATVQQISFLSVIMITIWIMLVMRIRSEYINSFRVKLDGNASRIEPAAIDFQNESIIGGIISVLRGDSNTAILRTLRMIRDVRNERFVPALRQLLQHKSELVKIESLKILYQYRGVDYLEEVEPLVDDPHFDVRLEALHFMFSHTTGDRTRLLQAYIQSDDERTQLAAVLCAARESRNNPVYQSVFGVPQLVSGIFRQITASPEDNAVPFTKIACARIIGAAQLPELYPYLNILLNDPSREVLSAAISACGPTRQMTFVPVIIKHISDSHLRPTVISTLSAYGADILSFLADHLRNPYVDRSVRINVPRVLSYIPLQRSVNILLENLEQPDLKIRYEVIKSLNRLRAAVPDLQFDDVYLERTILREAHDYLNTLAVFYKQSHFSGDPGNTGVVTARTALIRLMEKRLDDNLRRIFRLLGLKYPPADIFTAYRGIQSRRPDIRANSVEFLDNLLEAGLKKYIIPIVETAMLETIIDRTLDQLGIRVPGEVEILQGLLSGNDTALIRKALALVAELNDARYLPYVGALINHPEETVHFAAVSALRKMGFPV